MTDMTVKEHNEELVMEKRILEARLEGTRDNFLHLIGAILRQSGRKKMLVKADNIQSPPAQLERHEDGSVAITFMSMEELVAANGRPPQGGA